MTDVTPEPGTPTTEAGRQLIDDHMVQFYEDNHADCTQAEYDFEAALERTGLVERIARIEAEATTALRQENERLRGRLDVSSRLLDLYLTGDLSEGLVRAAIRVNRAALETK